MQADSRLFQIVDQEGRSKIMLLLLLGLFGLIGGLTYGLLLSADRIETRVFLGSFPISQPNGTLGRSIDLIVRSLIVPKALAEAGLLASGQTVQTSISDATIIFTSSVRPEQHELFKAIHQKIAEKTYAKAESDFSVQREIINAKIKSLEQSISARQAGAGTTKELSGQVAEANSRLETSASADGEKVARRCRMIEVGKKTGDQPDLVCDSSTLAAEQKLATAEASLKIAVDGRENRLKLDELEADLKVQQLLSHIFVEPAIITVAANTSIPRTTFAILAALLGALLGFIAGLTALTTWVILRGVSLEND